MIGMDSMFLLIHLWHDIMAPNIPLTKQASGLPWFIGEYGANGQTEAKIVSDLESPDKDWPRFLWPCHQKGLKMKLQRSRWSFLDPFGGCFVLFVVCCLLCFVLCFFSCSFCCFFFFFGFLCFFSSVFSFSPPVR